jgi:DNA repair photolyase
MPNWTHFNEGNTWGNLISVKSNAPEMLDRALKKMSADIRSKLRIFMASTTDPYQPIEAKFKITSRCLDVFMQYSEIDLLVIQTRSPLVARDFDKIRNIPFAWLSITIETDDGDVIQRLGGGPTFEKRLETIQKAAQLGIPTQIVVSPCLPYTGNFAAQLAESGVQRIVVDDFVAGDGSGGKRTAGSPFASVAWFDWRDSQSAQELYTALKTKGVQVGWSASGFCGIRPRATIQPMLL